MTDLATTSTEYRCECGRRFIIPNTKPEESRKCPKCGRLMYPYEEPNEMFEKKSNKKTSLTGVDDTLEYEYKFNQHGQRIAVESEPFSIFSAIRKFFALFGR